MITQFVIKKYRVKELYIRESLIELLHQLFSDEFLNFKTLTKDGTDPDQSFLRDYYGIFGVE